MAPFHKKLSFYLGVRADQLRRRIYAEIIRFKGRGLVRHAVLWDDPPVIYAPCVMETNRLFPLPADSLLLLALYNSVEDEGHRNEADRRLRDWRTRAPGVRFVVLANTAREVGLLTALGHEAVLINHNAFIDASIFRIIPGIPPRFDAIYDAQLEPYKRHYLAAKVPNLGLVSYVTRPCPDLTYARWAQRTLPPTTTWLNDPLARDYRRLDSGEVAAAYNAARCGLCLSEVEGAMYASAQYLLCGLPVVTTPAIGGRDFFFEDEFALTVDPTPEAVAAGVAHMLARRLDRDMIRRKTLEKIQRLRDDFVAFVQDHLDRHRPGRDFAAQFSRLFFHQLLRNGPPPRFPRG